MGCEYIDLCESHYRQHVAAMRNFKNPGRCDWCKEEVDERRSRRDYDEGMSGRVYDVCRPCIVKDNERARQEREDMEDWD